MSRRPGQLIALAFALYLPQAVSGTLDPLPVLAVFVAALLAGLAVVDAAGAPDERETFFVLPAGFSVVAVAVAVLYVAGLGLTTSFFTVLAAGVAYAVARRRTTTDFLLGDVGAAGWWATAAVGATSVVWTVNYLVPPSVDSGSGILYFPYFRDTAFLGAHVWKLSGLGPESAFDVPGVSGVPRYFYHYGAFFLGAIHKSLSGMSGIDSLTRFVVPVGYLCTSSAVFHVASRQWSAWAGLGAVFAWSFVPDPSWYGGSAFFSAQWLTHVTQNMNAGLSACLVAFVLVARSAGGVRLRSLLAGLAFLLSVVFFKAQLFAVAGPVLVVLAAAWGLASRPGVRRAVLIAGATVALAVVLSGKTPMYTVTLGINRGFLHFATGAGSAHDMGLWTALGASLHVLAVVLGVMSMAVFFAVRGRRTPLGQFFLGSLVVYALLCTLVRIDAWGSFEFEHRNLALVYLLAATVTGASVADRFARAPLSRIARASWVTGVVVAGVGWAAVQSPSVNLRLHNFLNHVPIETDVHAACEHLRVHTPKGAVVVSDHRFPFEEFSFGERRMYLSSQRILSEVPRWGLPPELVRHRGRVKDELFGAARPETILELASREGVDFALVTGRRSPGWTGLDDRVVFSSGTVSVVDLRPPDGPRER